MKQSEKKNSFQVKMLLNPHRYFLEKVFIAVLENEYRLLVFVEEKGCILNAAYPTMRGARIAFTRKYSPSAPTSTKPDWSGLFNPELTGALNLICNAIKQPYERYTEYNPTAIHSL